jgi:cellulose synthase operon protein C
MKDGKRQKAKFKGQSARFLLPLVIYGLPTIGTMVLIVGAIAPQVVQAQASSQGYTLLNRGLVNDAIKAFEQALKANPTALNERLGLAIAYQKAGQDASAWANYQQVLQADPNNRIALSAVGTLGGYRPEWQAQGIAALTTLLTATPDDTAARAQRALLFGYQGRTAEAVADYQVVLAANPSPEVILTAAQAYAVSGDYAQAVSLFDRYRATGQPMPDAAVKAYATALRETGKLEAAQRLLAARTLQPSRPAVFPATPGYALLSQGAVNDAIKAFKQALQANPRSVNDQVGLALAYQKAGQDENAWKSYQQVLQLDPDNRVALAAIGTLGGYRPEWQAEGLAALIKLVEISPGDNVILAQRALLFGYQGRFGEALADYEVVLAANPSPQVVLDAAQIYTFSGNYAQGLKLFDRYRATQTIPDNAITAYATALRETGKSEEAVRVLEARLTSNASIELRTALAVAYQRVGRADQAVAVLAPLRNDPKATLPLARALSQIARQTGDRALFLQAIDLYRLAYSRDPRPSTGFATEVADILSEQPETRAEALERYQQIAQQQPQDKSLKIKPLGLQWQLGKISRSEFSQQLQVLLQPLPATAAGRQILARTLVQLEAPDAALLPDYQALLQSGVDAPFLNYRIAQMLMQKGEFQAARQALDTYNRATGVQDPGTELLLAEIERRETNLEASVKRYEALISSNPPANIRKSALLGLAGVRQQQKRFIDALAVYDQLLSLNPEDQQARLGKVGLEYRLDRISQAEAEAALNQWLQTQAGTAPPPELFALVGVLPADPAREPLYETLINIDPENLAVQRRLLQVLAKRDPQQARARVAQMIKRDPNSITAYFIQGELGESLPDLALASRSYEAILQRQPENLDALYALGGVRFQQQRFNEAKAIYNRLLVLKPKDWDLRRILAELDLANDEAFSALHKFRQIQAEQVAQAAEDPKLTDRIIRLEVDRLKRRGFQPRWDRY